MKVPSRKTAKRRAAAGTAAAWLDAQPPERRSELTRVRDAVIGRLPRGYEEVVAGSMIVYQVPLARYAHRGRPLWVAALASPKSYLTLHLMGVYGSPALASRLAAGFKAAGKKLDIGKACIRFTRADDLALEVIGDIVASLPVDAWVKLASAAHGKGKGRAGT